MTISTIILLKTKTKSPDSHRLPNLPEMAGVRGTPGLAPRAELPPPCCPQLCPNTSDTLKSSSNRVCVTF